MTKKLFVDVETTGLDPKVHGLIQLAGYVQIGKRELLPFDFKCQPCIEDEIEDEALKINNITREDIKTFPAPYQAKRDFIKLLEEHVDRYVKADKFLFIAYNARFDESFVRSWFEKLKDNYFGSYFFYPPIDVMNMAAVRLMEERGGLQNFKLSTVCRFFSIEVKEPCLHRGLYDVGLTVKLFNLLKEGEPNVINQTRLQ